MTLKFYTDLSKFDINDIDKNVFDSHHLYFFVSLLSINLKKKFLSIVNDEAKSVFSSILKIQDQFVDDIEKCNYVLLPPFRYWDNLNDLLKKYDNEINFYCKKNNKKIILFYCGPENDRVIDLDPNIFIFFRCGSHKSLHKNNVYGIPTFCRDYYRGKILNKQLSLSFCGYAKNHPFRLECINHLLNLNYANFIVRDYWGGLEIYQRDLDSYLVSTPTNLKIEYIDNIEKNLYGLAIRGSANFSHRLNEILMMGRIPVLVNSDCILPFENLIDYEKHTVFITKENTPHVSNIDKIIRNHYESHSENDLIKLQKENRKLWEKYFTVDSAFNETLKLIESLDSVQKVD